MDIKETAEGVYFRVKAMPNSGENALAGTHNGMLKIKIAAAPTRGKANEELAEFLAGLLHLSKSRVEIIRGAASKEKKIFIKGLKKQDILKLAEVING